MVYPLQTNQIHPGFDCHQSRFPAFFRERKGNKHVDPRAQSALTGREGEINKSTTESEVECTTIINAHELKKKNHIEENQALIKGLIKRGGCCRWEGELSPKAFPLFVYEGRTTELLNQR